MAKPADLTVHRGWSDEAWNRMMDEFEEWVASGGQSVAFWGRDGKPTWKAFYNRMRKDPDFARRYKRALAFRALIRVEEVEQVTRELRKGVVTDENGEVLREMSMTDVRRLETVVKSHQWMVEKENRAVFGAKPDAEDPLQSDSKLSDRLDAAENRRKRLERRVRDAEERADEAEERADKAEEDRKSA